MLKALQQLNVEPIVLLKKINVNEERIKIATQSSLLASDSYEGDAMQRYQHLPIKPSDPRDHPTASSSLNLRINLKGIPSCHKRKASLEEAFTEADSAYTEKSKKLRSDHSSDGDGKSIHNDKKKPSYVEELKQVEEKNKSLESDKDKVKKLKSSEKERSSKSDHQPDNTSSQGGSVSSSHTSHKRTKEKKKKKYKDRSDKSPSFDKTNKSRSRHSPRADSRKQSDVGDGSHSEEEHIPLSNRTTEHGVSLSLSVPEVTVQDDDITDEEVFDESRNAKSFLTEIDAVTNEPTPRCDSALTVALEVDMVTGDHHLVPTDIVDLASPVKSLPLKSSVNEHLSDHDEQRDSHLHVKVVDAQNSNSESKEAQNIGIEINSNGKVTTDLPKEVKTSFIPNDLESIITNQKSSTTLQGDHDNSTRDTDEQIVLAQTSIETQKPSNGIQSASQSVSQDITLDTLGSLLTEKPTEMKTKSPVSPIPLATTESETMETTKSTDLPTSHDLSSLETPHREEQDAISKTSVAVSVAKMCGCIPIDSSLIELQRREMEIHQEQDEIKLLLFKSVKERKSLCQELKSLNSMIEGQKKDLATRDASISNQTQSTATLLKEVDRLREERTQIMAQRKNSHQTMLKTEFKLRELQLELCRKQLTEPDIKMDTTNPLYVSIQEDEKQVIELTEDIAKKSVVHKQLESMCQKTEEEFNKKNEEYQVLSKRLDEARKICESLQHDVDKVEEKINTITNRLKLLVDEWKQKKLEVLEMEEELIYIEMCKKLKEVEEKKLLLLVSKEAEDFPVDDSSPAPSPIPAQEALREAVADAHVLFVTTNVERAERVASVIVNSPLTSPGLSSFVSTEEPTSVSNILSKAVESVVATEVEAEAEMESESEPMGQENFGTESPQNQPMCLRMTPTVSSPPPQIEMETPSTDLTNGSCAPSSTTTIIAQPPPVSNSPPINKVIDSLPRTEAPQASPSQSLPPVAIAQSQDQISLSSLEIVLPFYAQIPNNSSAAKVNQNDEKILCQEIVIGVRNFNTWFTKHQTSFSSLDPKTLQQSAVYMKEYFVPFYKLLAARNTNANINVVNFSAASLMDLIVVQAQKSEWYSMTPVDANYMRQLLESNLRLAIDHGTKQLKKAPPSRVEFCPSSGAQSLPTFTIHPPSTTNESFRSSAVPNHSPNPRNALERTTADRTQPVVVAAPDSSPMGALNSMINSHARQAQNQPMVSSLGGETTIPTGTNGYMVADAHSGMARQNWNASPLTNGMAPYQPQPIQNTAIVAPMQYTSRHRMPNVPSTPSINPWHQMAASSGAQQYIGNNMMQPNSSRMPISPYASMNQFYRQPQQQAHFIPPNYQQGDPTLQQHQQQHQHQMVGFVNAENSTRQMSRVGVQMLSPNPSQRPKQHVGTPQVPATLQHPQHTGVGQQQSQQQQQTQQPVAHQNHHINQQQQRHMPQPSPPATNVQQRHFAGPQLEATRHTSTRRHSQEQQQVQVQVSMQGQTPPYVCSKCGEEAHQKCSGCQSAFYCSRDCQVAHWEEHGKVCSRQV